MYPLKAVSHLAAESPSWWMVLMNEGSVSQLNIFHPEGLTADAAPFNKVHHKSGTHGYMLSTFKRKMNVKFYDESEEVHF